MLTVSVFFGPVVYGLSDGGIHFSIQLIHITVFFIPGQTFRNKENNSVL